MQAPRAGVQFSQGLSSHRKDLGFYSEWNEHFKQNDLTRIWKRPAGLVRWDWIAGEQMQVEGDWLGSFSHNPGEKGSSFGQVGRYYTVTNKKLSSGCTLEVKSLGWTDGLEIENNRKKRFQDDAKVLT